jgi:aldehyde dehydrogenase (NAD+)
MQLDIDRIRSALERAPQDLYIGGQRVRPRAGVYLPAFNPATGQELTSVAQADANDVNDAVSVARRAFRDHWPKSKPQDRQAWLLRLADLLAENFEELAALDILDMGVPISLIAPRRDRLVAMVRYYAALAVTLEGRTIDNSIAGEVFSYTTHEPVGVVGAIVSWNSPLLLAVWKIAPAIAAGCAIVLKPADQTALSALRLGELCTEAGIPAGLVNIVSGGVEAGQTLTQHKGIDKIAFTGSTRIGQEIIRASAGNVKRLSLELGGKSPNIIFDDADLSSAIPASIMGAMANTGQNCIAGSRLYVHDAIYDEFVEGFAAAVKKMVVGDPLLNTTQLGPIATAQQLAQVEFHVDRAVNDGATLVTGGGRIAAEDMKNGFYYEPTVLASPSDELSLLKEEIFGPVVAVQRFRDRDEIIERANDTDYGLAAGVWSKNIDTAHYVARRLQAGTVWINSYGLTDAAVPFGGVKMSGYGRESGQEHIKEFLHTKSTMIKIQE